MENNEKRISFIQYLNTVILTIIGLFALMIFLTLSRVRESQTEFAQTVIKLQTVQEINKTDIDELDARVKALEMEYVNTLKIWIDDNYLRKPQK